MKKPRPTVKDIETALGIPEDSDRFSSLYRLVGVDHEHATAFGNAVVGLLTLAPDMKAVVPTQRQGSLSEALEAAQFIVEKQPVLARLDGIFFDGITDADVSRVRAKSPITAMLSALPASPSGEIRQALASLVLGLSTFPEASLSTKRRYVDAILHLLFAPELAPRVTVLLKRHGSWHRKPELALGYCRRQLRWVLRRKSQKLSAGSLSKQQQEHFSKTWRSIDALRCMLQHLERGRFRGRSTGSNQTAQVLNPPGPFGDTDEPLLHVTVTPTETFDKTGNLERAGLATEELNPTTDWQVFFDNLFDSGAKKKTAFRARVTGARNAIAKQEARPDAMPSQLNLFDIHCLNTQMLEPWLSDTVDSVQGDKKQVWGLMTLLTLVYSRPIAELFPIRVAWSMPEQLDEVDEPTVYLNEGVIAFKSESDRHAVPKDERVIKHARPNSLVLLLPVPENLLKLVRSMIGSFPIGQSVRLFRGYASAKSITAELAAECRSVNDQFGCELQPKRISEFSANRLIANPEVDRVVTALLVGRVRRLASVPLTYVALTMSRINAAFADHLFWLSRYVPTGGILEKSKEALEPYAGLYVGSRLVPDLKKLRAFIDSLRGRSMTLIARRENDLEALSAVGEYTLFWLLFEILSRRSRSLVPDAGELTESQFVVVNDKGLKNQVHARFSLLSEELREQLKILDQYREAVGLQRLTDYPELAGVLLGHGKDLPRILLFSGEQFLDGTSSTLWKHFNDRYPFVPNLFRHLIASEIHERGLGFCMAQATHGHGAASLGPFSPFSTFSFRDHKEKLGVLMEELRRELGFEVCHV